eukprot:m.57626 g.57626  ORF g.57626 m.57626 type:complete len:731 (-) comp15823_c0_seq1:116-2308(-)
MEAEVQFLKDQVFRLNQELAAYQARYPAVDLEGAPETLGQSWLVDADHLTPLITEYDNRLRQQHSQIRQLKEELHKLQQQASDVVSENAQLHRRLQMAATQPGESRPHLPHHDEQVRLLLAENDILVQEKDTLREELQQTRHTLQNKMRDIATLERQLADRASDVSLLQSGTGPGTQQDFERLLRLLDELKEANETLRAGQATLPGDTDAASLEDIAHSHKILKEREHHTRLQLRSSDAALEETRIQLSRLQDTLEKALQERDTHLRQITQLQDRLAVSAERESKCFRQLQNSAAEADEYKAQRNSLLERLRQQQSDVEHLEQRLQDYTRTVGDVGARQVEQLNALHQAEMKRLMEEVEECNKACTEANQRLQTALGRQRTAEKELERVANLPNRDLERMKLSNAELSQELTFARRTADEHQAQSHVLKGRIEHLETEVKHQKEARQLELSKEQQKYSQLEMELRSQQEKNLDLMNEVERLKRHFNDMDNQKLRIESNCAAQLESLRREVALREKVAEEKVQAVDKHRRQLAKELQHLSLEQQRHTVSAREDSRVMQTRFERVVADLKAENLRLSEAKVKSAEQLVFQAQQIEQLKADLQRTQDKLRLVNDTLAQTQHELLTAHEQAASARSKENALASQVQQAVRVADDAETRFRKLERENKGLRGSLSQKMELEQMNASRSMLRPLQAGLQSPAAGRTLSGPSVLMSTRRTDRTPSVPPLPERSDEDA